MKKISVLEVWLDEKGAFNWSVQKTPDEMTEIEIFCLVGVLEQIKNHLLNPNDLDEVGSDH